MSSNDPHIAFPDSQRKPPPPKKAAMDIPTMRSVAELAESLDISVSMVRKMMREKTGPAFSRFGNRVRFSDADVQLWLLAKKQA